MVRTTQAQNAEGIEAFERAARLIQTFEAIPTEKQGMMIWIMRTLVGKTDPLHPEVRAIFDGMNHEDGASIDLATDALEALYESRAA